jgi:hypothetical protein
MNPVRALKKLFGAKDGHKRGHFEAARLTRYMDFYVSL